MTLMPNMTKTIITTNTWKKESSDGTFVKYQYFVHLLLKVLKEEKQKNLNASTSLGQV